MSASRIRQPADIPTVAVAASRTPGGEAAPLCIGVHPGSIDAMLTSSRARWVLLLIGAALSLLTVRTGYDLPLAAWIFLAPLLAWNRGGRHWWSNALVLAGLTMAQVALFLAAAHTLALPMLLVMLVFVPAQVLPFVLDRLAAGSLPALAATLVYPSSRVATELALATLWPMGTAFGVLGYSQHANLPLLQVASLTGVYGVSFLLAWVGSVGASVIERQASPAASRVRGAVAACVLTLVAATTFGVVRLATAHRAPATQVAMVSPDPALVARVDRALSSVPVEQVGRVPAGRVRPYFQPINDQLVALTERSAASGARMVGWSEGAALVQEQDLAPLLARVGRIARRHDVPVLVGVGVFRKEAPHLRNQAILVQADGTVAWRYDKAHPIPVMNPYPAGDGRVPVTQTGVGRLASIICFDSDFPQTARRAAGADVLVVPVLDWDGIQEWHATNGPLRAVESGVTVVRPAAEGIHGAVDPYGRWLARQDAVHAVGPTVTPAMIPTQGVPTVYGRVGDVFAAGCAGYAALAALVLAVRRGRVKA